ncbi:MAG: prolyl oligopeptidase family serine peptidase [Gemmatimonadetes bacterium]|nr:prolyl oligopeptidase family serine peptidase [Gemmatimonadota bacterium]MBT5805649.1 prolyl oligopeptidase family serine peptidase [Gemmatimonadota bacterium]MBT7419626.1 prolyl oligopeptidase family serine peptidase [Gemmatimonadota bacterium]MBT7552733.1 prolyl oligopeptidase family serine peptidase [Gemmatimonadota bacterium]
MQEIQQISVDSIPLIYLQPDNDDRGKLVIWLTGFSGSKESCRAQLEALTALGYTALSFDPWQHGERMLADVDELRARVRGNIRRYFWPILAETAREVPRIIDWALAQFSVDEQVGIGGISMGGDISVVAAGIDRRIALAVPWVATPDWLRPGTNEPVGEADADAQACYDEFNPLTHLDRYAHCPRIVFQNGAEDEQVPPDSSIRFRDALRQSHYRDGPERIDAVLHPGIPHQVCDEMWHNTERLLLEYL